MMKFLAVFAIVCLAVTANAAKVRFDNFKLFRVVPNSEYQRQVLFDLQMDESSIIFWKDVGNVGRSVEFTMPPHMEEDIISSMGEKGITATIVMNNIQELIDAEELSMKNAAPFMDWTSYHSTDEIHQFMEEQAAAHPDIASTISIGRSYEGRDLKVMKISTGGNDKPIVWLDATLHAREWITPAIATYTINELLNSEEENIIKLREDFDWYIIPIMNPDGYEFSRTDNRMWRKTRSSNPNSLCRGCDPNRNWGYKWMSGGSSSNPCSDIYAGSKEFSEVENQHSSEFIASIADRMVFYLSLHSYSQLILVPYGYTADKYKDYEEFMRVGRLASDSIAQRYGTYFKPGNIVDELYVASGGSMDWVKGVFDTKLTFTFEMRDRGQYGFLLPPEQILPSCLEFMDGLVTMCEEVKKMP